MTRKLGAARLAGAVILPVLLVAGSFLFFTNSYFSYKEVKAYTDSCYDKGGFPSIEKSGWKVVSFDCQID
ncbi:hypothetical protein GJU40_16970 [Bacillus lacus]|uniref:Uncharacterized protein n=1 Tax=Metabacillus lacus TaxID=1983721 RepID=A0A7X2M0Y0_9BACI|nr:hypothetical protein [Metabacillus lacus]MRX73837.1 hypothetical protein [Metabacillus lacus]